MHKKNTFDISTVLHLILFLNVQCDGTVIKISVVYAVVSACEGNEHINKQICEKRHLSNPVYFLQAHCKATKPALLKDFGAFVKNDYHLLKYV